MYWAASPPHSPPCLHRKATLKVTLVLSWAGKVGHFKFKVQIIDTWLWNTTRKSKSTTWELLKTADLHCLKAQVQFQPWPWCGNSTRPPYPPQTEKQQDKNTQTTVFKQWQQTAQDWRTRKQLRWARRSAQLSVRTRPWATAAEWGGPAENRVLHEAERTEWESRKTRWVSLVRAMERKKICRERSRNARRS